MSFHNTALQVSSNEKCIDLIAVETKRDVCESARVVSKLNVEVAVTQCAHFGKVFKDANTWSELNSNLHSLGFCFQRACPEVWVSDAHSWAKICTGTFLGFMAGALENRFETPVVTLS